VYLLKFQNEVDCKGFENQLKKVCLYTAPPMKSLYDHIKVLGRGGQATVNLFKKKGVADEVA
jgi:hypothetical protein